MGTEARVPFASPDIFRWGPGLRRARWGLPEGRNAKMVTREMMQILIGHFVRIIMNH